MWIFSALNIQMEQKIKEEWKIWSLSFAKLLSEQREWWLHLNGRIISVLLRLSDPRFFCSLETRIQPRTSSPSLFRSQCILFNVHWTTDTAKYHQLNHWTEWIIWIFFIYLSQPSSTQFGAAFLLSRIFTSFGTICIFMNAWSKLEIQ